MYRIKNTATNRFMFGNLRFYSYEEARAAARALIRKLLKKDADADVGEIGFMDFISRNPTRLGKFKIVRVG